MVYVMQDNRQLLCTFSDTKTFKETVEEIKKFYSIQSAKFFIFINTKNPKEIYITYNVVPENGKELPKFPNTISIHRKKQTNTLYTLNAMNQIIKDENNGVFDKNHKVNWDHYQNSLIITGDVSIRIVSLKIHDILS
jgi:hypothetical protein